MWSRGSGFAPLAGARRVPVPPDSPSPSAGDSHGPCRGLGVCFADAHPVLGPLGVRCVLTHGRPRTHGSRHRQTRHGKAARPLCATSRMCRAAGDAPSCGGPQRIDVTTVRERLRSVRSFPTRHHPVFLGHPRRAGGRTDLFPGLRVLPTDGARSVSCVGVCAAPAVSSAECGGPSRPSAVTVPKIQAAKRPRSSAPLPHRARRSRGSEETSRASGPDSVIRREKPTYVPCARPRIQCGLQVRGRRRSPGHPPSSARHMAVCRPDAQDARSDPGGAARPDARTPPRSSLRRVRARGAPSACCSPTLPPIREYASRAAPESPRPCDQSVWPSSLLIRGPLGQAHQTAWSTAPTRSPFCASWEAPGYGGGARAMTASCRRGRLGNLPA